MDMLGLRNALKNLSWLGRAAVLCFYVAISNQFIRMVLSSRRELQMRSCASCQTRTHFISLCKINYFIRKNYGKYVNVRTAQKLSGKSIVCNLTFIGSVPLLGV